MRKLVLLRRYLRRHPISAPDTSAPRGQREMTDNVERLRHWQKRLSGAPPSPLVPALQDAADEIERLRAEVKRLRDGNG
jgi:HAMP domain-containing protein